MNNKNVKSNITFDICEVFVLLILIMLLTIAFKLIITNIRFLFLGLDFIMIYFLAKSLNSFKRRFDTKVIKYRSSKIEAKYLKKVRV